jgi:cyclic beta-1,2-glucan synthetase
MALNIHLEPANQEVERAPAASPAPDVSALPSNAAQLARQLAWVPGIRSSRFFAKRLSALAEKLNPVLARLRAPLRTSVSEDFRILHDSANLLSAELQGAGGAFNALSKLPHVQTRDNAVVPRVMAIAEGFLAATGYQFSELAFTSYVQAFQETTALNLAELWALVLSLKLVLLEQIAARAHPLLEDVQGSYDVGICIRSLKDVVELSWKEVIEPLILIDRILDKDPAGAYSGMDFDSRHLYRAAVENLAAHSDFTEQEVATAALKMAQGAHQEAHSDSRVALRCSHIGYYLVAEGKRLLQQKVGFRYPLGQRLEAFLKEHPDECYLFTVEVLTFAIMSAIALLLTDPYSSPGLVLLTLLALLLPCSQSALQVTNYLFTSLLKPQILPKMDWSEGIPDDCVTLVVVPALLLDKTQVRRLVDNLEVRFLGNRDPNLHFALLTDLPDSAVPPCEDDPLLNFCAHLIKELNHKYAGQANFFLFHRHRVYNPRERVWMGWERKRGKLLDLNRLLRHQYDSFPVKVGDLSVLPRVRFVITLDSDTELPRGSAHRMIGALAHPLNQAIIHPETNTVVAGYGILQPRVGISVQSAARSRLARIYSGQTGVDIYTRAVSDVYQDLFGEASFAGKGIYEAAVLHQVIDGRFPHNALLSHDLIEGAYARTGLASDIEIIEDYPSHYSAYNRRKHRWFRGDWQIAEWLTSRVPGESGQRVPNPISVISRWKILDNLRRSLVEPATVLLLVLGWLVLPGSPWKWTLAVIAILFVPAWCRFVFELLRATLERKATIARDAAAGLFSANFDVLLTLTFLAHQMLVSVDAMVRAMVRRTVTRRRLLEWETSAEAERGAPRRTPLDIYVDWTPALALALGLLIVLVRRAALPAALPILFLWACSKSVSSWLNRSPRETRTPVSEPEELFLRSAALRTWRYFAEFSNEEHNWLIPDNLQENPARVAAKFSPTNAGLILNARQVACRFGYLTVHEFAEQTGRTLATLRKLQRHRGHLFNWYDSRTLEPLSPLFVSSVDSGNLVASLWTLAQGCLDQLSQPFLGSCLAEGLLDHLQILAETRSLPRKVPVRLQKAIRDEKWLECVLEMHETVPDVRPRRSKDAASAKWFAEQTRARLRNIRQTVRAFAPWLLPEFSALCDDPAIAEMWQLEDIALDQMPDAIDNLIMRLQSSADSPRREDHVLLHCRLIALLQDARRNAVCLIQDLRRIAAEAGKLANEMDFSFLLKRRRKLLSIGFDAEAQQLHSACYDLLASESRIAAFVAIAKDDIAQESWFLLGRAHTVGCGRPVLLSWTGTMFEYLMPAIWMRSYPDTLLERSLTAAVLVQREYAAVRRIPWGLSESSYSEKDDAGNYHYQAFGVPCLAQHKGSNQRFVISPYSTFLALHVDASAALKNLRRMGRLGWLGPYGFYEAADYSPSRGFFWRHRCGVVRSWMAHHQGMSLLSLANFLHHDVVQQWFHRDPRVQATELLLQEKPTSHVRPARERYGNAAA